MAKKKKKVGYPDSSWICCGGIHAMVTLLSEDL
jgi:hypothetical protein